MNKNNKKLENDNIFFITKKTYEAQRNEIILSYKKDPQKVIKNELIMLRTSINTKTGKIETVPVLDNDDNIIPIDNTEYFTKKNGIKSKNRNFRNPLKNIIK